VESSTPSFSSFVPLPSQMAIINDIENEFDYGIGSHELLLSGSVGSSKSLTLAHLAIKHCLRFRGARVLVGRRSMPDLRLTIWAKLLEHLNGSLVEGVDYTVNLSRLEIKFGNKSEIICKSWADGQFMKMRSLELSAAILEEILESDDEGLDVYNEIKMRIGRLPHIRESWICSATNPGDPASWLYKHFITPNSNGQKHLTRHVYYSVTTDNPYLPPQYIDQLKRDLDPKLALRMLYGQWLSIAGDVVYHQYNSEAQYLRKPYTINPAFPVVLSWDFNLSLGKPMSMCCMQYIDDTFHIFDEVVIEGARTADTIDELDHKGLLRTDWSYQICGDAAGKHRDTRGSRSDWDIILKELQNRNLKVDFLVPPSNPGVRNRHNKVNAYCKNAEGKVRLFVYGKAPTVDEGLRLVKLKPGANFVEDDTKRYQHCTTALGYAVYMLTMMAGRQTQTTTLL